MKKAAALEDIILAFLSRDLPNVQDEPPLWLARAVLLATKIPHQSQDNYRGQSAAIHEMEIRFSRIFAEDDPIREETFQHGTPAKAHAEAE
jgi:hypothetical protein